MLLDIKRLSGKTDNEIIIDYRFSFLRNEFSFFIKNECLDVFVKGKVENIVSNIIISYNIYFYYTFNCDCCFTLSTDYFSKDFVHNIDIKDILNSDYIDFFESDSIDLKRLVSSDINLMFPLKLKCSEYCKGICQHCGVNKNEYDCHCVDNYIDSRLECLKNFLE